LTLTVPKGLMIFGSMSPLKHWAFIVVD